LYLCVVLVLVLFLFHSYGHKCNTHLQCNDRYNLDRYRVYFITDGSDNQWRFCHSLIHCQAPPPPPLIIRWFELFFGYYRFFPSSAFKQKSIITLVLLMLAMLAMLTGNLYFYCSPSQNKYKFPTIFLLEHQQTHP